MSDFAKKELLKTIRAATAAYLDLCASEMEAKNATSAEAQQVLSDEAEAIKRTIDCPTACQMAYRKCLGQPGADPAVCLALRTDCLDGC
ncbi:MAG: hypothetical protein H7145_22065 [Akkermansiaceae bacterium]|nr:hypothetical protein [Armatimonadota bacterium]